MVKAAGLRREKSAKEAQPKAAAAAARYTEAHDPWSVLIHPLLTEKCIAGIERDNRLVFIVDRRASKRQVRWAVEKALGVKVQSVNAHIDREGRKKALVRLRPEFRAADIATRFGML